MSTYVDIHSHDNEGFKVLVEYQSWRTAVLNSSKVTKPEPISYVEKHNETDEVFLLLKGKAFLIIGGDSQMPGHGESMAFEVFPLDLYKTYNVRAKVWHGVIMSDDASIYIVENIDTGKHNSDYYNLSKEEIETIISGVSLN